MRISNKVQKWEKINYKFRNYKKAVINYGIKKNKTSRDGNTAIFFGCSYPSYYPKTTKRLSDILGVFGIGTIYDCCGVPIGHMGLDQVEQNIIRLMNERLKQYKITKLIVVCPNCYYQLKDKIEAQVVSVYEKLGELQEEGYLKFYSPLYGENSVDNHKEELVSQHYQIYLPCMDKGNKKFVEDMKWFTGDDISYVNGVSCCGLGKIAQIKGPEITKIQGEKLNDFIEKTENKNVYVYCASCSATFTQNSNAQIHHMLNVILDSLEIPDIKHSFINRVKTKFLR